MPDTYSLIWDLDSLFRGGSHSPALQAALHRTKHLVQRIEQKFKQLVDLQKGILKFQELEAQCQDLESFIGCLLAQNVLDQEALQLHSHMSQLRANCESLGARLDALLASLDHSLFKQLLADPDIQPIAFSLRERRQRFKDRLPIEQELLVYQLAVDGYQGWQEIYHSFIGRLQIESPLHPNTYLSVGQAENCLANRERHVRQAWFQRWEKTWTIHEDLVAQILNHLAGFRLNLYAMRKWPSILYEPLFYNRMQEKTLQSMWQAVEEHKDCLQDYFSSKAQLLGIKRLAWYDVEAPLPFTSLSNLSFDQAAELIIRHFTSFSPAMGEFAKQAFEKRWIEAEDRPHKRPGGFCTPFVQREQSRIFMTYSGTITNLFTLAHELGHAYHTYEMRKFPFFSQQYRMNVAETASTLAETIVVDSMIQEAQDRHTQLMLLDYKLQRAVIFLMNIYARFLFEVDFYQARRKGFVLAEQLNHLMEQAQKRTFGHALAEWHPHFWVAKQHFYMTDIPFYNFPYSFGYLFSQGIYARLQHLERKDEIYASLLRDSGRLTSEELAYRHLEVNLEEPDFWKDALKLIENDVKRFLFLDRLKDKEE